MSYVKAITTMPTQSAAPRRLLAYSAHLLKISCLIVSLYQPAHAVLAPAKDQKTGAKPISISLPQARGINAETQATLKISGTLTKSVTISGPVGSNITASMTGTFPSPATNTCTLNVPSGTTGTKVRVKLKGTPGNQTYTATLAGTSTNNTAIIEAVRIDRARVFFHNQSNTSATLANPYPLTTDTVRVRVVVWATGGGANSQSRPYTGEQNTNDGRWWYPGSDGPQAGAFGGSPPAGFTTTPKLDAGSAPTIFAWPKAWPPLTKAWSQLTHEASVVTSREPGSEGGNRAFTYEISSVNWQWGQEQAFSRGLKRYRADVTLHPGTGWAQIEKSDDLNGNGTHQPHLSTRLAVRDATIDNTFLEWASTHLDEPYEWGGYFYGGLVHNDDGGSDAYDGYGIECSGLLGGAAIRSGYGWENLTVAQGVLAGRNNWRPSTTDLMRPVYTNAITESQLAPGDIIDKSGDHVVACWSHNQNAGHEDEAEIIHASGGSRKVIIQSVTLGSSSLATTMGGAGYTYRRLINH